VLCLKGIPTSRVQKSTIGFPHIQGWKMRAPIVLVLKVVIIILLLRTFSYLVEGVVGWI
jgi:hypothetical protein